MFDVLSTPQTPWKGRLLLQHAYEGARRLGLNVQLIERGPVREGAWVVLYGLGASERIGYANSGRLIAFDAGYWDRKLPVDRRSYRVAINGFHSPDALLRVPCAGADRWLRSGLQCAESGGNLSGPILLVGNGPKTSRALAMGWTAEKSRDLRRVFPGRNILYRPKPRRSLEGGIDHDGIETGSIEGALAKASLVVCRHSNVAVDACRAGVPVICEDGAAAAIYPKSLRHGEQQQPTYAQRIDFLERLAWWQWSPIECRDGGFWPWLQGALAAFQ
jgi:hypothetical protein